MNPLFSTLQGRRELTAFIASLPQDVRVNAMRIATQDLSSDATLPISHNGLEQIARHLYSWRNTTHKSAPFFVPPDPRLTLESLDELDVHLILNIDEQILARIADQSHITPPAASRYHRVESTHFQELLGSLGFQPNSIIRPQPRHPAALHAADNELRWELELGKAVGRVVVIAYLSEQKLVIEPHMFVATRPYSIMFINTTSGSVLTWPAEDSVAIQLTTRRVPFDLPPNFTSEHEPVIVTRVATGTASP